MSWFAVWSTTQSRSCSQSTATGSSPNWNWTRGQWSLVGYCYTGQWELFHLLLLHIHFLSLLSSSSFSFFPSFLPFLLLLDHSRSFLFLYLLCSLFFLHKCFNPLITNEPINRYNYTTTFTSMYITGERVGYSTFATTPCCQWHGSSVGWRHLERSCASAKSKALCSLSQSSPSMCTSGQQGQWSILRRTSRLRWVLLILYVEYCLRCLIFGLCEPEWVQQSVLQMYNQLLLIEALLIRAELYPCHCDVLVWFNFKTLHCTDNRH